MKRKVAKSPNSHAHDWRRKRYGRILGKDVERQLSTFREFARQGEELRDLVASDRSRNFWLEVAKAPTWANYYLESFPTLIARFVVLAQAGEVVQSMSDREFPADHIDVLESHLEAQPPPGECPELIGLLFALIANLESIALYSCTMNDLLQRAHQRACFVSLSRAAAIDVAVLSLQVAQFPMKALQLTAQVEMLTELLGAVAKGPHKRRIPYQELRWMEFLLREQGAFRSLTCPHS